MYVLLLRSVKCVVRFPPSHTVHDKQASMSLARLHPGCGAVREERGGGEEGQQPGKASTAPFVQTDYMRATNHLHPNDLAR